MVETIFTSPLFVETILPFLLVFTLVFAILEKTKILGDGKRQIDAIIAIVIGLIFVAFGRASYIVVELIPILGVALVVLLIFMLLLGSMYQPGDFKMEKWMKIVIGILIAIVVAGTVLILTGGLDYVLGYITGSAGSGAVIVNIVLIVIVVGAVLAVIKGGKDKESGSESS
jgi:hypothetical protein